MDPLSPLTTFSVVGADGQTHTYVTQAHDTTEALQAALTLAAVSSGPIVETVAALVRKRGQVSGLDGDDLFDAMEKMLAEMETDALREDLRRSLMQLAAEPKLVRQFFKRTERDGKRLLDDIAWEDAYKRNIWELVKALWEIIRFNGFLDFLPSSPTSETGTASTPQ